MQRLVFLLLLLLGMYFCLIETAFSFALIATVLFFCLDAKETKNQGCTNFTKIRERGAKGAETRCAQTAAPSLRSPHPDFLT
jgi:hypothetical protein